MKNKINELLSLFQKLNHSLNDYFLAYKELKKCMRKNESESTKGTPEKDKTKIADAERKTQYAKEESETLLSRIETLFNEGYFSPADEEMKNEIDDEYMELLNTMNSIAASMQVPSTKNCPDIIKMHTELIEKFNKLEDNITVYNHKAEEENWSFKFIYPEDAHKKYSDMANMLHSSWQRNRKKRINEGLIYKKP